MVYCFVWFCGLTLGKACWIQYRLKHRHWSSHRCACGLVSAHSMFELDWCCHPGGLLLVATDVAVPYKTQKRGGYFDLLHCIEHVKHLLIAGSTQSIRPVPGDSRGKHFSDRRASKRRASKLISKRGEPTGEPIECDQHQVISIDLVCSSWLGFSGAFSRLWCLKAQKRLAIDLWMCSGLQFRESKW